MNKTLNLLGLANRSGNIFIGEQLFDKISSEDGLIFLANDAGENISKKISNKADTYHHLVIDAYTTKELSNAIGKKNIKVILIINKGFIKTFKSYI
ncbi:MAG: hypothetical protein K9L74_04260 [Candidatus Izimaplasma sp.]|nr:hypothetical protein [Candidatus Izimaplasma bacterium]